MSRIPTIENTITHIILTHWPISPQIQHITDIRKDPHHQALDTLNINDFNLEATHIVTSTIHPPLEGAPTTIKKTSAAMEVDDIPPPHYKHGTGNTTLRWITHTGDGTHLRAEQRSRNFLPLASGEPWH